MQYVIGISFGFHDSSVSVISDSGDILCVVDEERFSRVKHDKSFPEHAIKYIKDRFCLNETNIAAVVYYEDPHKKLGRVSRQLSNSSLPVFLEKFPRLIESWASFKLNPRTRISSSFSIARDKVYYSSHHLSHALSSIYTSGFRTGNFLTLDGVGESLTGTSGRFLFDKNNQLKLIHRKKILFPHSIGLFYTAITQYLGFEVNEGEFKVMGLAPYGEPQYTDLVRSLFTSLNGFSVALNLKYFAFDTLANTSITKAFVDHVGIPQRVPESPLNLRTKPIQETSPNSSAPNPTSNRYFYADFAASCQKVVEETILECVQSSLEEGEDQTNLVCSGGVFYNSVSNGQISNLGSLKDIHIYPAAGDSGASLGSCFLPPLLQRDILSTSTPQNYLSRKIFL